MKANAAECRGLSTRLHEQEESWRKGRNLSYVHSRRREEGVKKRFEEIMKQVPILLEEACGGHPSEDEKALPKCSWEALMKQYILKFP